MDSRNSCFANKSYNKKKINTKKVIQYYEPNIITVLFSLLEWNILKIVLQKGYYKKLYKGLDSGDICLRLCKLLYLTYSQANLSKPF